MCRPYRRSARLRVLACVAAALGLLTVLPGGVLAAVGIGDRAPEIRLAPIDGRDGDDGPRPIYRRGQVTLVDFWASWCGPCRATMPWLDGVAQRHRERGLEVVAVSVDRDDRAMRRFLDAVKTESLTLLRDPTSEAMARFGVAGLPGLVLIDRDGVVRRMEAGYSRDTHAEIEAEIDRLLGGGGDQERDRAPAPGFVRTSVPDDHGDPRLERPPFTPAASSRPALPACESGT